MTKYVSQAALQEPWHLHYTVGDNTTEATLAYEAGQEIDMTPEETRLLQEVHSILYAGLRIGGTKVTPPASNTAQTADGGVPIVYLVRQFKEVDDALAALARQLAQPVDVDALAEAIVALLGPQMAGLVIPPMTAVLNRTKLPAGTLEVGPAT